MNKKLIIILNCILLALILAGDVLYIVFGDLWLKGLTSAFFVLLGVINLIYAIKNKSIKQKFSIILVIGLIFAMLGDIILNIHFISGAILFAVGHVFFFMSYCFLQKFSWKDLLFGAIIFIPSVLVITLVPIFDFGGVLMEIVCVMYALIISLMVGKAISNLIRERNLLNLIIVLGSVLFFFSDLMLLLDVFGNLPVVGILCLATYYPAEFLLAHSIYIGAGENHDTK